MSTSEKVHVQLREVRGTRLARRLRAEGQIPAVLYGHGEETVSVSVPVEEIEGMLRHGSRLLELEGAVTGSALVREVQWDAFGNSILHMDLTRVSRSEMVELTVPIELRGDAPGTHEGGVVEHLLHEIEVKCPVAALPEKLQVNVNHLEINQHITVGDLELPADVAVTIDPTTVVVQCVEAAEESEEAQTIESAEPEVIGRKESDEEASD